VGRASAPARLNSAIECYGMSQAVGSITIPVAWTSIR
jgi:hypothetical protein